MEGRLELTSTAHVSYACLFVSSRTFLVGPRPQRALVSYTAADGPCVEVRLQCVNGNVLRRADVLEEGSSVERHSR